MESEAKFIKGFSGGYILEQYEPVLFSKLMKGLDLSTEYLDGFSSGREEYQRERVREELNDLAGIRNGSKEQDMERQKNIFRKSSF